MSKPTTSVDQLSEAIQQELTIYNSNVVKGLKREARKHIKQLVADTKATAPVGHRSKHYRDSITSAKTKENDQSVTYVWYVDGSDYRLSHLLERGHANRDGGFTPGTHFIETAYTPILESYEKAVEEVIKRG